MVPRASPPALARALTDRGRRPNMTAMPTRERNGSGRWLNRTVIGVGAASFFSDVSHETATSLLPILAAQLGNPAAVLGAIEGFSDALSGAAKLWSGWISDRLARRKPLAVTGYLISAIASSSLGAAGSAAAAVMARSFAWVGRGIRSAPRAALLAADVPAQHYGKAFGLERAMDTLGAVVGPGCAALLLTVLSCRSLLAWTLVPGILAAVAMAVLVRERPRQRAATRPFFGAIAALPRPFRFYLCAVGLFGMGDFAHSMLILRAGEMLAPVLGATAAPAAAIGLYSLHNVTGALMAFVFGVAGDRFGRLRALTSAYILGPLMILVLALPAGGATAVAVSLVFTFVLAGAMRAGESALESAAAAQLLPEEQRGTGFGALAAVNSAGDFVSSLMVGLLWQTAGPVAAFGAAVAPMIAGILLLSSVPSNRGKP